MKIEFRGLICHVKLNDDEHIAVLLHEPAHVPRLNVAPGGVHNPAQGETYWRPLSKRRIDFGPQGAVNRTGLAGVPSLTAMTGSPGNLDADLQPRDTARNFTAFVELPGGTYSIADWFANKGDATNLGRICVPRSVVLDWTPPVPGPVIVNGVNPPLTLNPDATISITNLEQGGYAGAGFEVHGNIFAPPAQVSITETSDTCPGGTPVIELFGVTVECSNSTYP
jgi:hypothetical protein